MNIRRAAVSPRNEEAIRNIRYIERSRGKADTVALHVKESGGKNAPVATEYSSRYEVFPHHEGNLAIFTLFFSPSLISLLDWARAVSICPSRAISPARALRASALVCFPLSRPIEALFVAAFCFFSFLNAACTVPSVFLVCVCVCSWPLTRTSFLVRTRAKRGKYPGRMND